MISKPNLTLENAPIPAPRADPALVAWLLLAGLAMGDAMRVARSAARRMQFMPVDIKAAYAAQLCARQNVSGAELLSFVRSYLGDGSVAPADQHN